LVLASLESPFVLAVRSNEGMDMELQRSSGCKKIMARNYCPKWGDYGVMFALRGQPQDQLNCIGDLCKTQGVEQCCLVLHQLKKDMAMGQDGPLKNNRDVEAKFNELIVQADGLENKHPGVFEEPEDAVSEDLGDGDELDEDKCLCKAGTEGKGAASGVHGGLTLYRKETLEPGCSKSTSCSDCVRPGAKARYYCCPAKKNGRETAGPCGDPPAPWVFGEAQCVCNGMTKWKSQIHEENPLKCFPQHSCSECDINCFDMKK